MRTIATLAALSTLTTACLSNPARGTTDNGKPARLVIVSGTGVRNVQVEAGRSVTSYSGGGESETVNYRTVQQRFKWKSWGFKQGAADLDEQDWFKLRDPGAGDEIAKLRAGAWREQAIGLPLAIAGYAGMGVVQYGLGFDELGTSGTVAYVGASLVALAGTLLYLKGFRTMKKRHLLPLERAYETADEVSHCKGPNRCVRLKHSLGRR